MKKIALITFCVFAVLTSNAQQKFIGVKAAFALTNFAWGEVLPNSKFNSNFSTGVSFDYLFYNQIRFGVDLLLEKRGFSDNFILTDEKGMEIQKTRFSVDYTFISFPVKFGYTMGRSAKRCFHRRVYEFGNLGIIPAYLLQSGDKNLFGPRISKATNPKIDVAGMVELGAGYTTRTKLNVYSALRFQRSVTNALKEPYANGHSIKHYGISIFAGLTYQL